MIELHVAAAFVAGLVSFLSPCVLPIIPAFLGYLAGTHGTHDRGKLFVHAVLFVLGFSTVFAILGVLLNTLLTQVSSAVQLWLSRVAGILVIGFGLYLTGLLKLRFLDYEHKIKITRFSNRHITSFLFGAAFAVGWTPCVSAVLASILALAVAQPATAFTLLFAYSIGLGIPFLVAGLFADSFTRWTQRFSAFLKYANIVMGLFLIILGVLVFTQKLTSVANIGFILGGFFT